MSDLTEAKKILKEGTDSIVLAGPGPVYRGQGRGVSALLNWIAAGTDLKGYSAADKIVGKAAALLMAEAGIIAVYAPVMSKAGIAELEKNQIHAEYDQEADQILNMDQTGICPMEQCVREISDPDQAVKALQKKMMELKKGAKSL